MGAGIAPHVAQIAEVWIEIEGGIGYVEGSLFGGVTLMPPGAAGRCLPAARLAKATNRLPIPTELHRLP